MINRKKMILGGILLAMLLGLIGFRILDFLLPETEEEKIEKAKPENNVVENSILILSDGSIDAQNTQLVEDTLKFLFENDGYQYAEIVTDQGALGNGSILDTVLRYRSAYGTYEYVIICGGIMDLMIGIDPGAPGADDMSVGGTLTEFLDMAQEYSPYTNFLIVGVPYYEGYNDVETTYTIADYNTLLRIISDKYDNVYFMDFTDRTYEENVLPVKLNLVYDKQTIKNLYNSFNEVKKEIEAK